MQKLQQRRLLRWRLRTPHPKSLDFIKYKTTILQILEQARVVAEFRKKCLEVHATIQNMLDRAIRARERCAIWYGKIGVSYGMRKNLGCSDPVTRRHA